MKKAEQIFEEAIGKAVKDKMPYPHHCAVGALKAKYDMLRSDYLILKKEIETLNKVL